MPAPTAIQIATLTLELKSDATKCAAIGATPASDEQIIKAVDTVVDLYNGGVHDEWSNESALFTALDVLDDIVQAEAMEAMVPERVRDYIIA